MLVKTDKEIFGMLFMLLEGGSVSYVDIQTYANM